MRRNAPLPRWPWVVAIALMISSAACQEDRCKGEPPALEVQLVLDDASIAAQLATVRVDLTAGGLHKVSELDATPLKSGRSEFAVVVGPAGADGFEVALEVELFDSAGERLLAASERFSGSGDACNFFSLVLTSPRIDGPERDLGSGQDGASDLSCGPDQTCCTPDCTGKACGAEDGCGGSCASGECPTGQGCVSGSCRCTAQSCADGCCTADEGCLAGTQDTACGSGGASCRDCSAAGQTCSDQRCDCDPVCPAGSCNIADGCGGTCSCAANMYCNNTTCEQLLCQRCTTTGDCDSQCQAWGSSGGLCAVPGSTNPAGCCECNAVASGNNPHGVLDGVSADGLVTGWACDQDNPWTSINVHLYVGGPVGISPTSYATVADQVSGGTTIKSSCGGGDYHRFRFTIPNVSAVRGQPVYAYGINILGGENDVLSECPAYIP